MPIYCMWSFTTNFDFRKQIVVKMFAFFAGKFEIQTRYFSFTKVPSFLHFILMVVCNLILKPGIGNLVRVLISHFLTAELTVSCTVLSTNQIRLFFPVIWTHIYHDFYNAELLKRSICEVLLYYIKVGLLDVINAKLM